MSSDERVALAEPEIPLLDLAGVLAGRKSLIAAAAVLCAALTAVVVFVMPPTYTAEAVILPPQAEQSSQAMWMGSLAGLGGLGGLGAAASGAGLLRNPAELYIGVLKSRTIADALIATFRLEQVYGRRSLTDTRKELERRTSITTGRDSLIRIRVDDHDRARAAAIANAYADELHGQNSRLALTSAAQRRLFFERQLAGEKNALADAEIALKKTQQANGLIFPPGQSEALIRSIGQLRAEIAAREVQLESMRTYATGGNPQVQLVERELAALREQARALEAGKTQAGSMAVTTRGLPQASLDYIRRLRDLKYHETLFEILAKQYEAARIDEARLAPVLQVVDFAVIPDKKSWPPRKLLIFAAGCLGALAAGAFVLVQDYRRRTNLAL
jgi:tyrosine-protein kinase Etk/Wzc